MEAKILDTKSGETGWHRREGSVYWWTDGSGSCDCNRALSDHANEEVHSQTPRNICPGEERFLLVDARGDLEGRTVAEIVEEANRGYPEELRAKWLPGGVDNGP